MNPDKNMINPAVSPAKNKVLRLLETLHPLERTIFPHLHETSSARELEQATGLQEVEVIRALQWLSNKGILSITTEEHEKIVLDVNGKLYLEKGLPERRFLECIARQPLHLSTIEQQAGLAAGEGNVCIGLLKKKQAISLNPDRSISITDDGRTLLQQGFEEESLLQKIEKGEDIRKEECTLLLHRKDIIKIRTRKEKIASLTPLGKEFSHYKIDDTMVIDRVTPDILRAKTWEGKKYRRYDTKINVPPISGGKHHVVSQAIEYIKNIWLELGFQEMTGDMTQTAFWDLDSLFVPQDHPARAMQDTFYLGEGTPLYGDLPAAYRDIKRVHETGGNTGSRGWQVAWKEEEARRVLLRTHTTVLSALKLASLKKEDLPAKFFSVGRVFRNEALDWKHLFEFHQVDGIVIDHDANLKHLKGYLKLFFRKMGYPDARIRPAHFPYTEPSCEVDVWHPVHKQWIELGGAGIFRPEVVVPLLGVDVPVLAWGLGLERIISEYYQLTDIRDLYANDLKKLKEMKIWMK